MKYRKVVKSHVPPHIYYVADSAYQMMLETGRNQCCVIRYELPVDQDAGGSRWLLFWSLNITFLVIRYKLGLLWCLVSSSVCFSPKGWGVDLAGFCAVRARCMKIIGLHYLSKAIGKGGAVPSSFVSTLNTVYKLSLSYHLVCLVLAVVKLREEKMLSVQRDYSKWTPWLYLSALV